LTLLTGFSEEKLKGVMDVMFFGEHLAFEFGGEVDIKTVGKIYPSDAWRGLISKSVGFLNTFCRH